jgi:CBS domain-containing protein
MDASVTVREVMDPAFVGANESDDLRETVELMIGDGAGSAVVVRGREPVGILTQRDVLERVAAGNVDGATVADAMTDEVPTVDPGARLPEAASELSARTTQRLVVTDGSEPIGVLSERDLLSTSPFSREGVEDPPESATMATPGGSEAGVAVGFEDQSICEACGSFASDLLAINGQMLCADCRDI